MKNRILFLSMVIITIQTQGQYIVGFGTRTGLESFATTAAPPAIGAVRFLQDFEAPGGSFPFAGWQSVSSASDGGFRMGDSSRTNANVNWKVQMPGKFAYTHDDSCNCDKSHEELLNSAINLSTSSYLYLDADVYFRPFDPLEKAWVRMGAVTDSIYPAVEPANLLWPVHHLDGQPGATLAFGYSDRGLWGSGLALDNIRLYEAPHNNDLAVTNLEINGISRMNHFARIPVRHAGAQPMILTGRVTNRGRQPQPATLTLEIGGQARAIANGPADTLLPAQTRTDTLLRYLPSEGPGLYSLTLTAKSNLVGQHTPDDTLRYSFEITDTAFSRVPTDVQSWEGFWFGPGMGYRLVSSFELDAPDTATSISVWIDTHTRTGAMLELILLDEFYQNKIPPVFPDNFYKSIVVSQENKGKWNTWRIPPSALPKGKYWVGFLAKTDSVFAGVTADMPRLFVAKANLGQGWGNINRIPLIGLNLRGGTCPKQTISYSANASNCGMADGLLRWQAMGGTVPYRYFLRNFGFLADSLAGLYAGNYHLTAIDHQGCATDTVLAVSDNLGPVVSLTLLKEERCFGDLDGEIKLSSGGASGIRYKWLNGSTDSAITGLAAGNYSVTVTDTGSPGCRTVLALELNGPRENMQIFSETKGLKCFYDSIGSIKLRVKGATFPYTYQWTPSGLPSVENQINLRRGVYRFTVTDHNLCANTDSVELGTPDTLKSNASIFDTSGTGLITTAVTGGIAPYTYYWNGPGGYRNPGTPSIDKLVVRGEYSLKITDAIGCVLEEKFDLAGFVFIPESNTEAMGVFPNPCNTYVRVKGVAANTYYRLYDISGRIILNGKIREGLLNVSQLFPGLYVLDLPSENFRIQLIKQVP